MRRGQDRTPALVGAVALHLGVFAAAMLLGALFNKPVYGPVVTPVTLVSPAEQNPAPAIQTPEPSPSPEPPTPPTPQAEPQPEQPPAPKPLPPTPKPKPTPPPPAPAPQPTPAKAAPVPKPAPKPTPATPSKSPAQTAQPAPDDDSFLNSLSKDLAHSGSPSRPKPPSRPTPGTGSAPSAAALASLEAQVGPNWHPNCFGPDVNSSVTIILDPSGRLLNKDDLQNQIRNANEEDQKVNTNPVVAESDRAIRAVLATNFHNIPANFIGKRVTLQFDHKKGCNE